MLSIYEPQTIINHTAIVLSGVTTKSSTTKISKERHVLEK